MTAPKRIWAFSADDIAENEGGATIVAHESYQPYATEYVRADLAAIQPAQVRVKPMVWQHGARNGWKVGAAWTTGYHLIRRDDGWHYGNGSGGVFQSLEAAKAAAQADYEARILAALEPQPDPRDEVIARLVEAAEALLVQHALENPMRMGDFHSEMCQCRRCGFDRLSAALASAKAMMK